MKMKSLAALTLALLMIALSASALAAVKEPKEKTLEATADYSTETLSIQMEQWCYNFSKKENLRFFIVDVVAQRPEQLQTAFAGEQYSKEAVEATSAIAARHDAVIAINGDYYNYKEDVGTVIRNGVLYRDKNSTRDHLLIGSDGSFDSVFKAEYEAGKGQSWIDQGVVQCFTFGPTLVDGGVAVELPEKYGISTKDTQREPRAAIGWVSDTHYVIVIADGRRNDWSEKGMTLQELQQIFVEQGCQVAYNLDGGGSTTLIINGEKINKSSGSRERDVSDIVYFTN